MRRTAPLALFVVAGLVGSLAACSAPGGSAAPDPEDSPLNKYMMAVWGGDLSPEEQEERFAKEQEQREELVAECMTQEGFEYIPVVQDGTTFMSDGEEWKPEDREWVAQYGYGMVNYPGRDEPMPTDDMPVDPNQDYVTSLSESEQQAYYEVLHGPPVPEDQMNEDGSYEYDWEQAGCYGYAQHEVEQSNPAMADEFKPLMTAMEEFWTETHESEVFDEIDAEWSACMADAGHAGYDAQMDAQTTLSDELNEYYENQTEWVEDDPELAEFGEKEIEVALADLECREETGYRAAYAEIQYELEEEFIAAHKADLDALKAAAEQGR
ncbi:hypothetical protein [Microbacterium yannicii]|uniref:hypothetical protein n=1 Tax=Microbacterium yannicii TaxID=671622 RepID=UPI0002DDEEF7|nr:hypothetical protein [Microbacterium yannicii]